MFDKLAWLMNPEPLSVLMPAKLSRPRLYYEDLSSEANAMGPIFFLQMQCRRGSGSSPEIPTGYYRCFVFYFFIFFFVTWTSPRTDSSWRLCWCCVFGDGTQAILCRSTVWGHLSSAFAVFGSTGQLSPGLVFVGIASTAVIQTSPGWSWLITWQQGG